MRQPVLHTLLPAVLAIATAAAPLSAQSGSGEVRDRVLIPEFPGPSGEQVSDRLRDLLEESEALAAVSEGDLKAGMTRYRLKELDEITARQLAQQLDAPLVAWGTVERGGAGLQADVTFFDSRSGDQISLEDLAGSNGRELAQVIFTALQQKIEGLEVAAQCSRSAEEARYEQALQTCDRALALVPGSSTALYGKATALQQTNRPAEALPLFQQVLASDAANQGALLGAGAAASRLGRGEEALAFFDQYLQVNSASVEARVAVAAAAARAADFRTAYRLLEPAGTEPNLELQKLLTAVATAAGQSAESRDGKQAARPYYEAALRAYNAAYVSGGTEADPSAMRQVIAVTAGLEQTERALELARQATIRFAGDAGLWLQYGGLLAESGRSQEAITALTRAAETDPTSTGGVGRMLYNLAAAAIREQRNEDAIALLEPAHRFAPEDSKSDIAFFWGYSLFRQAEAITKANTEGKAPEAERALPLFKKSAEILAGSQHQNAAQMRAAAEKYIEYAQAVIRAGRS